jgi:hypothetical protein
MKTAMQLLIDRINDLKISCSDPDANWLADMLIRDISEGSKFDKSFLEMEKEQIIDTFIVRYTGTAEEYYNETYNTNEK